MICAASRGQSCAIYVDVLAVKRFVEMELRKKFRAIHGTLHQLRVRWDFNVKDNKPTSAVAMMTYRSANGYEVRNHVRQTRWRHAKHSTKISSQHAARAGANCRARNGSDQVEGAKC
jgi:hypothetical protein